MATNLAPVYVNDSRVTLQGDPKPQVSKIMEACGKAADTFDVVRLRKQNDSQGTTCMPEDVIDRTAQVNEPVYLKCIDRDAPKTAGIGRKEQMPSGKFTGKTADAQDKQQSFKGTLKPASGSTQETAGKAGKDSLQSYGPGAKSAKSPDSKGGAAEKGQAMYDPHKETGAGKGERPDADAKFGKRDEA